MLLSYVQLLMLISPWVLRGFYDYNAAFWDAFLLLLVGLFFYPGDLFRLIRGLWEQGRGPFIGGAAVIAFLLFLAVKRYKHARFKGIQHSVNNDVSGESHPMSLEYKRHWPQEPEDQPTLDETRKAETEASPLKPMLFPCRTSHTRFFPKEHSFSYSYLYVGIPVGWTGSAHGVLSADIDSVVQRPDLAKETKAWFDVEAEDYLDRGDSHLGLKGKLNPYLRSQGIRPEDYPYAYLVTAPRIMGFSFNPISFWYLYSKERELMAMILEVNNTFDERRMYFLEKGTIEGSLELSGAESDSCQSTGHDKPSASFSQSWPKDFHVSPFNSRKGSYSLLASDPFFPHLTCDGEFSNTITLSSSKNYPKLEARVFSTNTPIAADSLSRIQTLRFVASWWWVGLMTNPRILREAWKLYFNQNLHVWYRPEVAKSSIGRTETKEEEIMERCFRAFLKHQVECSAINLTVKYIAAGRHCIREESFGNAKTLSKTSPTELEFRVRTPAFYSQFVRYAHNMEAMDQCLLCAPEEKKLIWVSNPAMLPVIFQKTSLPQELGNTQPIIDQWRWSAMRRLRKTQSPSTESIATDAHTTSIASDIRTFPLSSLDRFVIESYNRHEMRMYRKLVMAVLISDHIAFGQPLLLRIYDSIFRMVLVWVTILGLAQMFPIAGVNMIAEDPIVFAPFLRANALHIWALIKAAV